MPIGIDLASRSSFVSRTPIRRWCAAVALIALSAGCNAVINFDDIDFGDQSNGKHDSAADESGKGGTGGRGGGGGTGGEQDSGSNQSDMDGSMTTDQDGSVSDGSTPEDSGMDSSVTDGGDQDSGNGNSDAGHTCQPVAEVCDNGADDDCDTESDCDDRDCWGQANCCSASPETTQSMCTDQRDNDCNGKTDCDDSPCTGTLACCVASGSENNAGTCGDGIDDDCDGKFDCADPDCAGIGSCCADQGLGPVTGCCTPDGQNETDQPNDGKDNDCDGLVDIPILMSAFPTQGLPSSADEVRLTFMTEIDAGATLSCSTTRPGQPQAFGPCAMSGMSVKPFTAVQSANPANNGVWITQVRWDFDSGAKHSAVYTFKYYVHSTLHGVTHCTSLHSDAQWFTLANTRLGSKDAGAFKLGVDTFLANPFVRVKYQLPVSSVAKYMLNGETPTVDMWSLRRRFTLNPTNRYLLITRNYQATRSGTCSAGSIRVHITHWSKSQAARNTFHAYSCDAIVINRAGTGVCMDNGLTMVAGPKFTSTKDSWDGWPISDWQGANKFMFRNLTADSGLGAGVFYGGRNFSSKCATAPCSGIYLPDRSMFP
jgi:hypothetical protein